MATKNKQQWKKHTDFSSGISRLQYVQLCMIEYIHNAQTHISVKNAKVTTDPSVRFNQITSKIFCSKQDKYGIKEFSCIGCNKTVTKGVKWIKYEHMNNAQSPMCRDCYKEAFSIETITNSLLI
jgi:hypothetical protein